MTDINREILARIGNLSVAFATLECELVDCVAHIVNSADADIGEVICDRLSFTQTVTLLVDLVKRLKNDACVDACKELAKRLRESAIARNDILHSSWEFLPEDGATMLFQRRARRRDNDSHTQSATDLVDKLTTEAGTVCALSEAVFDFKSKYLK